MSITDQKYWQEVKASASYVVELAVEALASESVEYDRDRALELIHDYILHEHIDGHKYTIYYAYHLPILHYSDNAEYAGDNFGGGMLGEALKKGLADLYATLAYWAFYADVYDAIDDAIADYEEANGIE